VKIGRAAMRLPGLVMLAAFAVACAGFSRPDPTPANPPFYKVEAPSGATMYLLGSYHAGPPGGWKLPDDVEAAFARAETLVVEVDMTQVGRLRGGRGLRDYGQLPRGQALWEVIGLELHAEVAARMIELGGSIEKVEEFAPWFTSLELLRLELANVGLHSDEGVDMALLARKERRDVIELESFEEQLALFASLSLELQILMLRDQLARGLEDEAAELARVWKNGDDARLAELMREGAEEQPAFEHFYRVVLYARDRSMADRLLELLAQPGRYFTIVGAGHVVGVGSIPDRLAQAGMQVERIQSTPPDVASTDAR
jgi:uncharacterized protein YbaP (TraB family)